MGLESVFVRAGRLPIKTGRDAWSRAGTGFADDSHWVGEAARVVLPGLRVVGEGGDPPAEMIDLMASAGGVWVGVKRR